MNRMPRPWTRLALAIAIPILAFISLVSWGLSSAPGSSPDDDFHLAAIWCGIGDRDGLCEDPGDDSFARLIPGSIEDSTCYAFDPDESAACWESDVEGMKLAHRANIDGLYPPLFYAAMAPFASTDVQASVLVMRVLNAAFAVGLLTGVFFALPRRLRPALIVSVLATSVPLGVFLLASTNPSSWAILSAATVWICLYGALSTTGRQRLVLTGLAVFCALIGAGARADSAVYTMFGVVLALILGLRRRGGLLVPLIGAGLIAIISVAFYLTSGQSGAALTGLEGDRSPLTPGQHLTNFLGVPGLWVGALGKWGLGWLDTIPPDGVWVLSFAVFAGALFVGIHAMRGRRVLAVLLALAGMWLVPFALLAQSNAVIGTEVQPRYILPVMIIMIGVASMRPDAAAAWFGMRYVLAGTALVISFAVSLYYDIRRYTTGLDGTAINLSRNVEWWWPSAPSPMAVWVVGSLAFAVMLVLFWVVVRADVALDRRVPADRAEATRPADDTTSSAEEASVGPAEASADATAGEPVQASV